MEGWWNGSWYDDRSVSASGTTPLRGLGGRTGRWGCSWGPPVRRCSIRDRAETRRGPSRWDAVHLPEPGPVDGPREDLGRGTVPSSGGHADSGSPISRSRIAAYARHDHYADLRRSLEAVAVRLRSEGWRAIVVADDNALVDRAAAVRAGIGWWGRNANVLLPGRGSWFVLGSVVTDAPLPPSVPLDDGCGTCRQCLDGCPTGAILERGVIDARRCLAWLVQAPGPIPREFREALGGRLYGCDECQEVCPVGRSDRNTEGSTDPSADVDIAEVLDASDEELLDRFGRWYIAERDPRFLRRNALVALGNTGQGSDPGVEGRLSRWLADRDPLLRVHAVWAAGRLGRHDLLVGVDASEPEVAEELAAARGRVGL